VELVVDANRFVLRVRDDGVGFDVSAVHTQAQGVFGMRHRVEARHGRFSITSRPGSGTWVTAIVPASQPVAAASASVKAEAAPSVEYRIAGATG
jgi:signal transduction histidine kinase